MCGHVIGTFGIVNVGRIAVGCEPRQDGLKVAPYVGVGVLAEDERSARVLQERRAKAITNSARCNHARNVCRNLRRAASASAEFKDFVLQHYWGP